MPTFWRAILTGKVGQADLVFGVRISLVGLCMQDYKSLCVQRVMICATLVNIETQTDSILTSLYE